MTRFAVISECSVAFNQLSSDTKNIPMRRLTCRWLHRAWRNEIQLPKGMFTEAMFKWRPGDVGDSEVFQKQFHPLPVLNIYHSIRT